MRDDEDGLAAVITTAQEAAEPKALEDGRDYAVLVPDDHKLVRFDTEAALGTPRRKRGVVTLLTGESLAAYVNVHKGDGSALYADVEARRIVAVLNGHSGAEPGWGDHRAELVLRHTPEWKHWTSKDGQMVDQHAFAEHIEEGLLEITEPPGADMLELAQTFQADVSITFRSMTRLSNGQRQLSYEEQIDGRAGKSGEIVVPAEFVLALPPFEGNDPYRVVARLRFRLREGRLSIGYVLDRPEDVIRSAFGDVLAAVETQTALAAYRGRPA